MSMTSPLSAPAQVETFEATIVESRLVTPRVKQLVFERVDRRPFRFTSGQWVSLVLPIHDEGGRPLRRSYSISSAPGAGGRFELLITRVEGGRSGAWLHDAPVGTALGVRGPQGYFTRDVDAGPSLLIATGTGVAPFRGFVHDALAAGSTSPLWILLGVRTLADAPLREHFSALEAAHPNFRLLLTLSRADAAWSGRTGYVQEHVLTTWDELSAHGAPQAWICGVGKMTDEVRAILKTQANVERRRLHSESYD